MHLDLIRMHFFCLDELRDGLQKAGNSLGPSTGSGQGLVHVVQFLLFIETYSSWKDLYQACYMV